MVLTLRNTFVAGGCGGSGGDRCGYSISSSSSSSSSVVVVVVFYNSK
jgi:hypothetical protein